MKLILIKWNQIINQFLLSLKYKLICQKSNINNNKLYNNNRNLYVIYVDIIIFIT